TIQMPPLRTRKGDIPVLAEHFLKELAAANGKPVKPLGEDALPLLMTYDWPGNVRELRAAAEHGVVMSNSRRVMATHLPAYLGQPGGRGLRIPAAAPSGTVTGSAAPASDLDIGAHERGLILAALERAGNNRSEAAEL